jgi:hypothetical protein
LLVGKEEYSIMYECICNLEVVWMRTLLNQQIKIPLNKSLISNLSKWIFLELHSTTQILTTRTHTHPYEHTCTNPTLMSTSEGLSTGRSGES